jgi:hypothetical protein
VIGRDGVSSRSPEDRFIGLSVPSAEAEDNPQDEARNPPIFKHLIRRTPSTDGQGFRWLAQRGSNIYP